MVTERYVGKVTSIEGKIVHVSLWDERKQEIPSELPRVYFPMGKLKVGMIFEYRKEDTVRTNPPAKTLRYLPKE